MSDTNETLELAKEVAKDVYADGGRPIVKPTGELLGLVPRAIKAALLPIEKWVLQREYNIEETKKLLEEKLKDVPPEQIQPPEAHVAVPALQYISYCMDNEELRDMYANLLANSMNSVIKDGVHPGFVEIIKQLCPDEAKILKYMSINTVVPTISVSYTNKKGSGLTRIKDFSNVGELTNCERPLDIKKYFDNLTRLGLIVNALSLSTLTDKKLYKPLKEHPYITACIKNASLQTGEYGTPEISENLVELTEFGQAFCSICLS